jgi:2-methylcitrate dehydratase PrpD
MSATLAQQLADVASQVRLHGLSPDLRRAAARSLLDVLGNSLAAARQPVVEQMREMAHAWGGTAQSSVILGSPTAAPTAALLNGTMAHALDFDDTHLPSILHPSAAIVPAALAVAELVDADGIALLDAIAVGVEVTCRLGMAGFDPILGNSIFFEHGMHATSICGTIGAAVACSMLLDGEADVIRSSIGISASMGAGIIEANRTGGTVKRIHCGWAAHAGVVAAQAARSGVTGPPTVLEGRFGFLQAYLGDRADVDAVIEGLGTQWMLPTLFFKPYPCNHFTHAGIDAVRELRSRGFTHDDVVRMELGVATPTLRTIGEPQEEKARPRSGYHAAFSGPYTVAAAWFSDAGLGVFHEDFTDEAAQDSQRLDVAARVTCVASPECDAVFPFQFPAILRAELANGSVEEVRVMTSRGGPDRPLSDAELELKYQLNAEGTIPAPRAQELSALVMSFPTDGRVRDLRPLLSR